jgi:superfamily II DNA or RNA helicase
VCASAYELIGSKQALWFCASVDHARKTAGVLSRYATGGVSFLSGDTPREDRRGIVESYQAGRIQHLVNCSLFLEGFDCPATWAIIMARPTKSVGLYMQVLGRGTRPLPGIVDGIERAEERRTAIAMSAKPNMLVIDFAGNAGKHKIVQASDVLGGKYEPPEREYAKQTLAEEGRVVDIDEALKRAQAEVALLAEEEDRRKAITATVTYQTYNIDPFVRQYNPQANGKAKPTPEVTCSDKQAGYICHLSREAGKPWRFADAKRLTPKQASGVIKKLLQGAA